MNTKEIIQKIDEAKKNLEECIFLLNNQNLTPRFIKIEDKKKIVIDKIEDRIDFFINERAFFKKYSKILSSGQEIFVFVVAYLSKGEENKEVHISSIQKTWNKIEGICHSKYASIYATRAKDNDWVNSPKSGVYNLRPKWKEIISK